MRIGMVAGEPSGDVLAAGLIREIKSRVPDAQFYGVGGEHMMAQGFEAIYSYERISVMGFESVIKSIRSILAIRTNLKNTFLENPPDCFIGIDVPDFNIGLEKSLRQAGIKVVHYVSPSVWAWRGYRIKKIGRAIDHMLTLFPFEKSYYDQHQIPATFVGHPTADKAIRIRNKVDLSGREHNIALLPGSRTAEVLSLLPAILGAAKLIYAKYPKSKFILPFASQALLEKHQAEVKAANLPIDIRLQQSGESLCQSKLSIVASGTAALEALIYGSVMVVVYKVKPLSAALYHLFKHIDHFSLPNQLLANAEIPELSQSAVSAENIFIEVQRFIENPENINRLNQEFSTITSSLHKNTDVGAAKAVLALLGVMDEPKDAQT